MAGEQLELSQQIEKFKEFFEELYLDELLERLREGRLYMRVPFSELAIFSPDLATAILETPEETTKAAQMSLQNIDLQGDVKDFEIRFSDLPSSQHVLIREIRSEHIGRFLQIEGIVRQKSDVRPQVTSARFECPSCGNIIPVLQLDKKFREPSRCGCGRKGKFHLLSKQLVDAQNIVLEEAPEDLEGGEQPKRMNVILQKDLVSPMSDRKTNPGSKIVATGVVKEVPIALPTGGQSTRFDLMIDANFVDALQEDYTQIKISKEEEEEILAFANGDDPFGKLTNSLAPTIYGHDQVKEALILQLLGGCRKSKDEGVKSRGDIHVLLIGDPGAGKCVAKDTLIQRENGLIQPINELFSEQKNDLIEEGAHTTKNTFSVVSLQENGQVGVNSVPTVWRRKTNKLLRVRMRSGTELLVTHEHPFFTTKNGVIHSIPAQELRQGTPIASPKKIVVNTELQEVIAHTHSKSHNKVSIKAPAFVTPYFGRLLGYLTGDGWVSKKTAMISLTNNDEETLKDYKNILSSMKVHYTTRSPHTGKTAKEVYSCSSEFHSLIVHNAPELIKEKTTPLCVMKSGDEVVAHFLKSLFECDAHVSPLSRSIQFSTKSKQLAQEVRMLLLRFSIQSQLRKKLKCATNTIKKTKRRYYEIVISGENVTRYKEHIGFVTTRKQQVLSSYTQKHNTNRDVIPGLNKIFRILRAQDKKKITDMPVAYGSYRHYEKGDRLPSRTQAKKILESYTNESVLLDLAKSFVNADVFWDFVEEITQEESDGYVYDLEVSTTHNFVANTAYIHNSQLLKRVSNVAPKARFVGGKGASGAGLTASVVKDEFLRGWALEAGALVLANRGLCCIDELDKMSDEDRSAMHEALEQQTVTISKANIQATLRSETTVLAAANPKFGRFDPYELLAKQIELPSTLINRFDLIFPIRDLPSEESDTKLAQFILKLHQRDKPEEAELSKEFIRKYLSYAKLRVRPVLSNEALEEIREYYVKMRNSGGGDGQVKAIPISARQLEALVRLSEASAKSRLAKEVTKEDARKGIGLVDYCLRQIGMDPESGQIDIDRITTGITARTRSNIHVVKDIINELVGVMGDEPIPVEDIVRECEIKGVSEKNVDEVLEKLKRSGDIYSPKQGFISKI